MTQCPICSRKLCVQSNYKQDHKLGISVYVCLRCNKTFDMASLKEICPEGKVTVLQLPNEK